MYCHSFVMCLMLVWGRFGVGLGSVWDRFSVGLGSVWDRFWVDLGSVLDRRSFLKIDHQLLMKAKSGVPAEVRVRPVVGGDATFWKLSPSDPTNVASLKLLALN